MKSQHPSFALTESDAAYFCEIPRDFLRPLLLLHHEKMNYLEIARQTGLPRGTVATRIFRARDIIKRLRAIDEAARETWQAPTLPARHDRLLSDERPAP